MIPMPLYAVVVWALATGAPPVLAEPPASSAYERVATAARKTTRALTNANNCLLPRHCGDLYRVGQNTSGVYTVFHEAAFPYGQKVYCDMETDGGGWTVIQRRGQFGNSVFYFKRNWEEYANGFGEPAKEYWIGNNALHALTSGKETMVLRVILTNTTEDSATVDYASVRVDGEDEKFRIHVGDLLGPEGWDSLGDCDNRMFSTFDDDNDIDEDNCANAHRGGWWYSDCYLANLNGLNMNGYFEDSLAGIEWITRGGSFGLNNYSYPDVLMAIRPDYFRK